MKSTEPVSPYPRPHRLLGLLQWVLFSVVVFVNDRLMPAHHPLDAQGIWAGIETRLARWDRFLQEQNPGPVQYRGRALDPQSTSPAVLRPVQFSYRGLPVERQIPCESVVAASQPYVPLYQRRLNTWLLNLGLGDVDRLASTPALDPLYRGQKMEA